MIFDILILKKLMITLQFSYFASHTIY